MENRKDIGNAFNEKLSTLDKSPREQVWIGIQEELDKKKKRRGFIFWFILSAIIIGTITSFAYLYDFRSDKPSINKVVTSESNAANENNSNSNKANATTTDSNKINSGSTESKNADLNDTNSKENGKLKGNELVNSENEKSGKADLNKRTGSGSNKNSKTTSASAKSNIKNGNQANADTNLKNSSSSNSKKSKKSKYKKAGNLSETNGSLYAENSKAGKNSKKKKKSNNASQTNKANTSEETIKTEQPSGLAQSDATGKKTNLDELKGDKSKPLTPLEERKLRLEEMKKTAQKKRDSIVAARKEEKKKNDPSKNPTDEEPKDSTKTETAKSGYEITVAPYYGYNYTGNFGNGNFINDSKTSKKGSEFNTSYGALIRIMGSSKIGMQLGVGIINSVYSADFIKESNSFINQNDIALSVPLEDLNQLFPNQTKVTSRQETTFIEVPLEAYYILSDKKFGMATSFGISFLKFQKNEVFLESDGVERMKIGKLENISPFSSSVNAKFHLFYKITPKLYFDLYPSFQYQFMGYKGVSNYHPYFFSIKTGLSYKL